MRYHTYFGPFTSEIFIALVRYLACFLVICEGNFWEKTFSCGTNYVVLIWPWKLVKFLQSPTPAAPLKLFTMDFDPCSNDHKVTYIHYRMAKFYFDKHEPARRDPSVAHAYQTNFYACLLVQWSRPIGPFQSIFVCTLITKIRKFVLLNWNLMKCSCPSEMIYAIICSL